MRNRRLHVLAPLLLACGFDSTAAAHDKSPFTLFNPTPRPLMRDFSTDRPDVTESAYTLDAGHVQLEMSLVEYTRDNEAGDFDQFAVAPFNLKVGLTSNVDLQLVLEPWIHQELDDDNASGLGVTQLRMKINLFGNDGGDAALAVMPFVQFPTADDDIGGGDHLGGGLIVPLALSLPADWTLSMMGELDALRNEADGDYGLALVHSASLGHPIAGALNGYVEYVGVASVALDAGYVALVGAGMTYLLRENVQLDGGVYLGLSDAADDLTALLGLSFRM